MCNHHYCHHFSPAQCIIPPYMTDKLISSNDTEVVTRAINSQLRTSALRSNRKFMGTLPKDTQRTFMAVTGAEAAPTAQLKMRVYDARHFTDTTHATLLWEDDVATGNLDCDAKNVINAGKATWDFYHAIFGRNSIDNMGMMLKQYIHYGIELDNAMWNGMEMVYGDGDGRIFGSFTSDPDIIGHELTHGVTQFESNLEYHNQSGALNESLSDVFGIMIKQRMRNEDVKKANWLIGENVVLGNAYALRSMKAPGTAYNNHPDLGDDPQPATMDDFLVLPDTYEGDWGGVHYNSGIPNFAFYVAAYDMGSFAWERAGCIWYAAMTDARLTATSGFAEFKALTIEKAEELFGTNSKEASAVKKGWTEAKV